MKTHSEQSVIITGCSSGFGREMVATFLENGWTVFATMRRAMERRDRFADELARFGHRLTILECDVTSRKDREAVRDALERADSGLDCLINNAGYMLLGPLEDMSEEQLRAQMETNFFGTTLLTRELLPLLRKKRGIIINVSSVFGFSTWPLTSIYCASKYAVEGLTQSLRQELKPYGVRVVLLEPGSYPTSLAENIDWSDRSGSKPSAYQSEIEAYRLFRARSAKSKNGNVSEVAQAAVQIARSQNPRLRNPIGIGSKVVYIIAHLLPSFSVTVMDWIARRLFHPKRGRSEAKPL